MRLTNNFQETNGLTDDELEYYLTRLEMATKEAHAIRKYRKLSGEWNPSVIVTKEEEQ